MAKKCMWENCGSEIEQKDAVAHLKEHLTKTQTNTCLWEGCKYKQRFASNATQQNHFKNHFTDKEWSCKFCFNLFSKEDTLKKHIEKHDAENLKFLHKADVVISRAELRDDEIDRTKGLLDERQHYISLARILSDEIVRDRSKDDSWNDYL